MDSDILEDVTGWSSRPFADGYDGLRDLAGREFSGAVTDGMAWLFFLNGNVVGVFDGTIEDFEDADGTAYEAPHPSLPLLYTMQETGGETRAKYYTNDTSISEVDRTLSAGNFTGYVELSENVLSGDYYTVYHGGRSMSAAYVGSSRRLVTGDEAFEKADDEVGIYEVKTVPVEITEIPGDEDEDESVAAAGATSDVSGADDTGGADDEDPGAVEEPAATGADTNAGQTADTETTDGVATQSDVALDSASAGAADATDAADTTDATDAADAADATDAADAAETTDATDASDAADTTDAADAAETTDATDASDAADATDSIGDAEPTTTEPDPDDDTPPEPTATDDGTGSDGDQPATEPTQDVTFGDDEELDDGAVSDLADEVIPDTSLDEESPDEGGSVYSAENEWRETKTIPALDPDESMESAASGGRSGASGGRQGSTTGATGRSSSTTDSSTNSRRTSQSSRTHGGNAGRGGVSPEEVAKLKEKLSESEEAREAAEAARERLATKLESVEAERDDLRSERDDLQARAEKLDARVDELEAQVDRLESELTEARASQPDPERAVSPQAALDETNLFVRYDSKSGGTLEKAHDGRVDREEVNTNLRLEHHTGFEADEAHVDGEPFETFLHESIQYGFVRWVVEDLLYEIRDTGHEAALQDLYDAIPKIDRAELNGTVSVEYTENGEQHREQQRFDVVLRDRMGNPLLVANLNDSREAASEGMMRELVENSRRLAETSDSLGAGFLVTASFFAPEALETASDATSGGLLSRSKRESFVKLSRKQGFHLCLVETRNGDFHLNVPEL